MDQQLIDIQRSLNDSMKQINDAYDRAAKALGLSSSAFDILYSLVVEGEGCTQTDICEMSYSSKQTVNSAIHKLEGEDVICLEPGIGRSTLVYLTDKGKALAEEKIVPVVEAESASIAALSASDRAHVAAMTARYTKSLVAQLDAVSRAANVKEV